MNGVKYSKAPPLLFNVQYVYVRIRCVVNLPIVIYILPGKHLLYNYVWRQSSMM